METRLSNRITSQAREYCESCRHFSWPWNCRSERSL